MYTKAGARAPLGKLAAGARQISLGAGGIAGLGE
jgi:hypothetical protein